MPRRMSVCSVSFGVLLRELEGDTLKFCTDDQLSALFDLA